MSSTDTPQLSERYYKARRNLVVASSILLAWEFVGFEVRGKEESAGDTSASLFGLKVDILNPEVIPTVVFFITIYTIFRISVEWSQSSSYAKSLRSSYVEHALTVIFSVSSIFLFLFQSTTDFRLAEYDFGTSTIADYSFLLFVYFISMLVTTVIIMAMIDKTTINKPIILGKYNYYFIKYGLVIIFFMSMTSAGKTILDIDIDFNVKVISFSLFAIFVSILNFTIEKKQSNNAETSSNPS